MARTGKGILSDFSGKVGTVVGSSWKGIAYMRSLPQKKRNRSLTEGQETQQAKFALASRFVRSLSQLLRQSYQVENGRTARNSAISIMLTQAIVLSFFLSLSFSFCFFLFLGLRQKYRNFG